MTLTPTAPTPLADTAAGVLDAVRETRAARDREDARLLVLAVQWAVLHPEESICGPGTFLHGDRPVVVAGAGAPLVGEFAVAELAAALRMPTEAGRDLVGEALELCHRLPRLWARVQDGSLPAWRARRIARATMLLSRPAAGYVDDRVASFAHRVGPATVDRLVEEALVRFDPASARARALASADDRGGSTSSDNLAALCRRHHRLKTFGGWSYTTSAPGRFTWTSPHGHRYRRDRHGTVPLDPDP